MREIAFIRTGGQTGVERAALAFAREHEIAVLGWCPKGGVAEDMPVSPGVRAIFPELAETLSDDPGQWTMRNVRDAHATLIILPKGVTSSHTSTAEKAARELRRPLLEVWDEKSAPAVAAWLMTLGDSLTLNVDGPSAGECPQAHVFAKKILHETFCLLQEREIGESPAAAASAGAEKTETETEIGTERDPVFVPALRMFIRNRQASISLLVRKFNIGYARASKIIEKMEELEYIGPFDGAKSRPTLITKEEFAAKYGDPDQA